MTNQNTGTVSGQSATHHRLARRRRSLPTTSAVHAKRAKGVKASHEYMSTAGNHPPAMPRSAAVKSHTTQMNNSQPPNAQNCARLTVPRNLSMFVNTVPVFISGLIPPSWSGRSSFP